MAMSTPDARPPTPRLLGRQSECAALDELMVSVRGGSSRSLVLRGEAGVGKSALLEYLVRAASGCAVARLAGVESEVELAFAGLHQVCATSVDRLERLPAPQRDALGTALGLREGDAPDRFLVGLAVLSLLSDTAEERPLVCVVDDAQWLDSASAQALAFVARRLGAESVGLVFAVREPGEPHLEGLPELVIGGLDDGDARALLEAVVAGPLDERVRDRIVAETHGNPLALLELPRGRTPAQLAGGFGLDGGPALAGRIEERFQERLAELPPPTRLLLLVAAAEPVGDPLLVWGAAAELGIEADAAAPANAGGLIELGAQVRFRHPLVRSAVYGAAPLEDRQRVHRALAEVTDADVDPDRRAWHHAQATVGLDEDVAAELERSAGRARARGGLAAGAAFHERAAQLTPDPARRARRALGAAQGKHQAGAPDEALRLLGMAQAGPLGELGQAQAQLLHAQITFAATRGRDAPPLLIEAAKRLEPLDATLARETYLDAFAAALSADRLAQGGDAREVAAAVLAADWGPSQSPRACDLLLDGLALLTTEGYTAGAPALKLALRTFRDESLSDEEELRWLWLACHIARALGDDTAWDELTVRQVELARRAGALSLLPVALDERAHIDLFCGRLAAARSHAAEADAVVEATGSHLTLRGAIALAIWRGQEAEALALIRARRQDVMRRGEGVWLASTEWGSAVLYNGLGRYDDALAAAERVAEDPQGLGTPMWVLSDLIEAAVRSGKTGRAAGPLERLAEVAEANGTEWALGILARSRAMLGDGETADRLYGEAIERLGRTRIRVALARAHLVYGEWLRREHRRVDAREQLRAAHEMLADVGMEAFAERARRELLATGETVRKRTVETLDELTPQEAQIGRMAADGFTNPEIGAQLFLSPRTVEWHLRKVFGKLGISSRRQLRTALPDGSLAAVPV
jgi:DNA-binding CsgD family transcriptional regulator